MSESPPPKRCKGGKEKSRTSKLRRIRPKKPHCCLPTCNVKLNPDNRSFHEFPSDLRLRAEWIKILIKDPGTWNPRAERERVCSLHFTSSDFVEMSNGVRRLKRNSLPILPLDNFTIAESHEVVNGTLLSGSPPGSPTIFSDDEDYKPTIFDIDTITIVPGHAMAPAPTQRAITMEGMEPLQEIKVEETLEPCWLSDDGDIPLNDDTIEVLNLDYSMRADSSAPGGIMKKESHIPEQSGDSSRSHSVDFSTVQSFETDPINLDSQRSFDDTSALPSLPTPISLPKMKDQSIQVSDELIELLQKKVNYLKQKNILDSNELTKIKKNNKILRKKNKRLNKQMMEASKRIELEREMNKNSIELKKQLTDAANLLSKLNYEAKAGNSKALYIEKLIRAFKYGDQDRLDALISSDPLHCPSSSKKEPAIATITEPELIIVGTTPKSEPIIIGTTAKPKPEIVGTTTKPKPVIGGTSAKFRRIVVCTAKPKRV